MSMHPLSHSRMVLSAALDFCAYVYGCTYAGGKKKKSSLMTQKTIITSAVSIIHLPSKVIYHLFNQYYRTSVRVWALSFGTGAAVIDKSKVPVLRVLTFPMIQTKAE